MIFYSNANQVVKDSLSKLKAFNRDSRYNEQDMCIDYYQYNNTQRYIEEYFSGTLQQEIPLYTVNMTKRLIDRTSLVYKNAPGRVTGDEIYTEFTRDKNFTFKRIERIHNLLGTMAMQVMYVEDKFIYIPRLEFEPIFNPDDPMTPVGIVYPLQNTTDSSYQNSAEEFVYWDKDQHFAFNANGNIKSINKDNINPYGILPFAFIQPNHQVDEFINTGSGKDIAKANCQIDIAMTMLQHHIRKAGGQFVIQGNVETNSIQLGLNKVVVVDDGQMSNLNPNVDINSIIEGIKFQLQQVAINHHLSFDFGNNGSKSGVALKIENIELLEAREDDVEKFKRFEKDVYKIEQAVSEIDTGKNLSEDFNIDFAEIDFPDFEREREEWDWKFNHGMADVIDYLISKDPDRFGTDDDTARPQWEEYLASRKRSATTIKENGSVEESIFTFGKK